MMSNRYQSSTLCLRQAMAPGAFLPWLLHVITDIVPLRAFLFFPER